MKWGSYPKIKMRHAEAAAADGVRENVLIPLCPYIGQGFSGRI
jgi:hypothetical protein